jgi:hypothetical protein
VPSSSGGSFKQSETACRIAIADDDDDDAKLADAGMLAKLTSQLHGQAPGLVGQLLGGGGMKGHPLVNGALGGIAATAAKRFMGK